MSKKTLLSGIQPSGSLHIGNYFGAIRQFVSMQEDHNAIFMIVDYHALNSVQDREVMSQNILNLAIDYLALGLDPKKSIIFKQSDVSEHTELCWIFDTITTMPFLMEAHAFKAAVNPYASMNPNDLSLKAKLARAENAKVSVGVFNYPMLMAADILLYDTDVVPVGQDQKQHVEYTRDTAQKFNNVFKKDVFKLPDVKILEEVAVVPGTDGRKMSKSYGNTIPLFATDEEIEKAVMSIVTDSGGDVPQNVYVIHKLLKPESELKDLYENNKGKYKVLKEALIADMKAFIKPLRDKREQLAGDVEYVLDVLKEGGKRAKLKAEKKMDQVREAIGVKLY